MEIIHTINKGDKVNTKINSKSNKSVLQVTVRRKTAVLSTMMTKRLIGCWIETKMQQMTQSCRV